MSGRAPGRQKSSTAVSACALQAHRASLLRLEPAGSFARQGPSLAQRLGLAPAPPAPLNPSQWLERHQVRCSPLGKLAIHLPKQSEAWEELMVAIAKKPSASMPPASLLTILRPFPRLTGLTAAAGLCRSVPHLPACIQGRGAGGVV